MKYRRLSALGLGMAGKDTAYHEKGAASSL